MTGLIFAHAFYINVSRLAWYALACEFKAFWHVALGYCRLAGNPFFAVVSLSPSGVVPLGPALSNCWRTQHIHTHVMCLCASQQTPLRFVFRLFMLLLPKWLFEGEQTLLLAILPVLYAPSFLYHFRPKIIQYKKKGRSITWHSSFCKLLPIFEGKSVSGCLVYIALKREKKIV